MNETVLTNRPAGSLRTEPGERAAVHFERLYDATPDELWSAVTEPERLRGWLAHALRFELVAGGAIELRFDGDDGPTTGRVREVVPGRVVEWEWHHDGNERSLVRFEVVPRPPGALLVLDHRLLCAASAPGYGAGWQGHLDALDALLRDAASVDVHARWRGVHDSVLRFDLRPDGGGTHMRLEHRALSPSVAGDHGSGWHAYLDALADVVEGREVGSWDEREVALRRHYERRAAALS